MESCTNCVNARTDGQHIVCTVRPDVGLELLDGSCCVCVWVSDSTKPDDCPGWLSTETDAERCANVAFDELTLKFHRGEI